MAESSRASMIGQLPEALTVRLREGATLTRRDFVALGAAVGAGAALVACGGGAADSPTSPGGGGGGGGGGGAGGIPAGVTVSGLIITVSLTQQVALTAPGGFLVVTSTTASAIIICLGTNSWKAFTSTCTHQGCTVNSFAANRINCPCHGSQFDTNGSPVAGPAPSPLVQFPLTFDATANTVQVTTS